MNVQQKPVTKDNPSEEHWMKHKWRPTMAWVYMAIVMFDFLIGPILWSLWQSYGGDGAIAQQWSPITLGGGGLFHLSMGAILGITAWSRGREKMMGVAGPYGGGMYSATYEEQRPVYPKPNTVAPSDERRKKAAERLARMKARQQQG